MTHVVTERCVDCRYTDCCTVCPVDCFYEVTNPAMLVIDPNVCIDCAMCVPECPIAAIWPADELPAEYAEWTARNEQLFPGGTNIKTRKDALPSALPLGQLQARERGRGWAIAEPSGHQGGGEGEVPAEPAEADAAAGDVSEDAILSAAASGRFKWRSAVGLSKELSAPQPAVKTALDNLVSQGKVRQFPSTNKKAPAVFGAVSRVGEA